MTEFIPTNDYSGCLTAMEAALATGIPPGQWTKNVKTAVAEHKWSKEEFPKYMLPHPEMPRLMVFTPLMVKLMSAAKELSDKTPNMSFAKALSVLNGTQVNTHTGDLGRVLEVRMDSFEARLSKIEETTKETRDLLDLMFTTLKQRLPKPAVAVAVPTSVVPARVEPLAWGDAEGDHHQ